MRGSGRAGLAGRRGVRSLPMVLHPLAWINIVRHARRLTGVDRLHALVGGLHLGGRAFEPVIPPTVAALTELAPSLVVPGHCTGWRAQHALASALPDAWVQSSSGTAYRLCA